MRKLTKPRRQSKCNETASRGFMSPWLSVISLSLLFFLWISTLCGITHSQSHLLLLFVWTQSVGCLEHIKATFTYIFLSRQQRRDHMVSPRVKSQISARCTVCPLLIAPISSECSSNLIPFRDCRQCNFMWLVFVRGCDILAVLRVIIVLLLLDRWSSRSVMMRLVHCSRCTWAPAVRGCCCFMVEWIHHFSPSWPWS